MFLYTLSYLLVFTLLGYMGYTTTIIYTIPIALFLLVYFVDKESLSSSPLKVFLGISLATLYEATYFLFMAHPNNISPLNYIFVSFTSFLIAIYMLDSKKLSIEVMDISFALVLFIVIILIASPFLLSAYKGINGETKLSWIANLESSINNVYGTNAHGFMGILDNMMQALNPNTYIAPMNETDNSYSHTLTFDPSSDLNKEKDESFNVHLLSSNNALFYSSFYKGSKKEIDFKMSNEKVSGGIYDYSAGYIFGNNFLIYGMECLSSNNQGDSCLTSPGQYLPALDNDVKSIVIQVPDCSISGKLFFFKKYISLAKSRKTIYLSQGKQEKTQASPDPLSVVIGGSYVSINGKNEVYLDLIPYVSSSNTWERKVYVPYMYVEVPSWLTPTSDCVWKKKSKIGDKMLYVVDIASSGGMCIEGGKEGQDYRCTFSIKDKKADFFNVYVVSPYLIKEIMPSPNNLEVEGSSNTVCSPSKEVESMLEDINKYFDYDKSNVVLANRDIIKVQGALLKGNINNAIYDLAELCAKINKNREVSGKCFSISFSTKNEASAIPQEREISSKVDRGKISISPSNSLEKIDSMALSSLSGKINDKVEIKMRPDSVSSISPGHSYILDISYSPGCDKDVVWVNIYD